MTGNRPSFWRRNKVLTWIIGSLCLLLVLLAGVASIVIRRAEPFLRARIVEALSNRFQARVELDSFQLSLFHGLRVQGNGLRIWPPARVEGVQVAPNGGDPLISLDQFKFHAPLRFRLGAPFHISVVELNGLNIHLPPKSRFHHESDAPDRPTPKPRLLTFGVDKIVCDDSHFVLETNKPGKLPLDFAIRHFQLTDSGGGNIRAGSVMHFSADLTNPRPVGIIHTDGNLGPWYNDDPGESAVNGDYTFDHADLSSFKGIAGTLSSNGKYQGTLRNLIVDGETDTPNFKLTHFGNTLPLHTHFHARVDATNGDTWLEPVDAILGHSYFTAQGQIVRVVVADAKTGELVSKGHDIALNVNIDRARIEDFLHLTSNNSTPLLTGALAMKASLHIPPGAEPIHRRIAIKGWFSLDDVRFTSDKIQGRITDLSLRGQGQPHEIKHADAEATRSTMEGHFQMANALISLPALTYTVPGATIQLAGTYGVEGGALQFAGKAKLNATVSQMVGGVLGFLLKPADRLFKKNGVGTEIPIYISGTRQHPEFGVDFHP